LSEKVVNKLLEIINSPYPDSNVHDAAYQALGQVKIPESLCEKVVTQLLVKLNDPRSTVCTLICTTLSGIKLPESLYQAAIEELINKTHAPNWYVSAAACKALAEVKLAEAMPQRVINLLLEKTNDAEDYVRAAACQALAKTKIQSESQLEAVVMKFIESTNDKNRNVRKAVCLALAKMRVPENLHATFVNQLMTRINDKSADIRKAAYQALYENLSLLERLKLVVKLEAQQTPSNLMALPWLIYLTQDCQRRNALQSGIASYLPPDKIEDVESFVSGKKNTR
jgi:HEAT repeat protein